MNTPVRRARRRTAVPAARWWYSDPPADEAPLVICFPLAGTGASLYRKWPGQIAGAHVRALQLPGRENRIHEPLIGSVSECAALIADFLRPHSKRGLILFGHCSGATYALETVAALYAGVSEERRPPVHVVASSWGAPHLARYGWMNFVDLEHFDSAETVGRLFAHAGAQVPQELVHLMGEVLTHDLVVQRPYLWPADRRFEWPTTVLSWDSDEVVEPETVHRNWGELGDDITHVHVLTGTHFNFTTFPAGLATIMEDIVSRTAAVQAVS